MSATAAYIAFVVVVVSLMVAMILHNVERNIAANRELATRYKIAVDGPVIRHEDWVFQAIIIAVVSAGTLPIIIT